MTEIVGQKPLENGKNLLMEKKYEEAIEGFSTALAENANLFEAFYYRACARLNVQSMEEVASSKTTRDEKTLFLALKDMVVIQEGFQMGDDERYDQLKELLNSEDSVFRPFGYKLSCDNTMVEHSITSINSQLKLQDVFYSDVVVLEYRGRNLLLQLSRDNNYHVQEIIINGQRVSASKAKPKLLAASVSSVVNLVGHVVKFSITLAGSFYILLKDINLCPGVADCTELIEFEADIDTPFGMDPDRPFNQNTYICTHNAFANFEEGWPSHYSNQTLSIQNQILYGVRGLMIDVHPYNGEAVIAHSKSELLGVPIDLVEPWHSTFSTNPVKFEDFLRELHSLLNRPRFRKVVLYINLESHLKSGQMQQALEKGLGSNFRNLILTQEEINQNLSFREILRRGKRYIMCSDDKDDCLPYVWTRCVETVHGNSSLDPNSWVDPREEAENVATPLTGIMNHFPTAFYQRSVDVAFEWTSWAFDKTNDAATIKKHSNDFIKKYGFNPTFIAVDFFELGKDKGVSSVVTYLNSVCGPSRIDWLNAHEAFESGSPFCNLTEFTFPYGDLPYIAEPVRRLNAALKASGTSISNVYGYSEADIVPIDNIDGVHFGGGGLDSPTYGSTSTFFNINLQYETARQGSKQYRLPNRIPVTAWENINLQAYLNTNSSQIVLVSLETITRQTQAEIKRVVKPKGVIYVYDADKHSSASLITELRTKGFCNDLHFNRTGLAKPKGDHKIRALLQSYDYIEKRFKEQFRSNPSASADYLIELYRTSKVFNKIDIGKLLKEYFSRAGIYKLAFYLRKFDDGKAVIRSYYPESMKQIALSFFCTGSAEGKDVTISTSYGWYLYSVDDKKKKEEVDLKATSASLSVIGQLKFDPYWVLLFDKDTGFFEISQHGYEFNLHDSRPHVASRYKVNLIDKKKAKKKETLKWLFLYDASKDKQVRIVSKSQNDDFAIYTDDNNVRAGSKDLFDENKFFKITSR